MKSFRFFAACAAALIAAAAVSCSDKNELSADGTGVDETAYAAAATIASDYSRYSATDGGAVITFPAEGGEAVVSVSCAVDWTFENSASDIFSAKADLATGTLTITAEANYVESELTGAITLLTASQGVEFAVLTLIQSAYGTPEVTIGATEWRVPAVGELSFEVPVEYSAADDYEASSSVSWLTVEKTDAGIIVTADENADTEERTGTVTVTAYDAVHTASVVLAVTQDGSAYVTPSNAEVVFARSADTQTTVNVESNFDWGFTANDSWINVSRDGDVLTISVEATDAEREGTITLTTGDGFENVAENLITVCQSDRPMVLVFSFASSQVTIKLPFKDGTGGECTVDCTVDWGDGTVEKVTSTVPEHKYEVGGEYVVVVDGTVTAMSTNGVVNSGVYSDIQQNALKEVRQWGHTGLTNMYFAFANYIGLQSLPEITGDSLSEVTDFRGMFDNCQCLTSIPADLFAQSSKATSFYRAFYKCFSLKEIPARLFANCHEVESFEEAFYYCQWVTSIGEGLFDGCSKVTSFNDTFQRCTDLTELPSDLFKGCSNVATFAGTFSDCTSLASVPKELFDSCTEVTDMSDVFYDCPSLTEIPSGLFDSCSKVTGFGGAFSSCTSLKAIPAGLFDNCTSATSFQATFIFCESLTSIPEGLFAKCVNATNFTSTFRSTGLEAIPTGLFDNCVAAEKISFTFYDCPALKSIPKGLFDKCTEVTTFYASFQRCTSLTEIPSGLFDSCTKVTDFCYAFESCTSLAVVPTGLFDHNAEITLFTGTFRNCSALTDIPPGLFSGCRKVTNFSYTFQSCTGLTCESPYDELEIDGEIEKVHLYDRSSHTDLYSTISSKTYCFRDCLSLTDYNTMPTNWHGTASTSSVASVGSGTAASVGSGSEAIAADLSDAAAEASAYAAAALAASGSGSAALRD